MGVQMGRFAAAAAAHSLAVDSNLAALHFESEPPEMLGDAGGKCARLDGLEDAREGVVARDAVGELEPLAQPAFAQLGESLHEYVGSHPAEHGGKGDEEDLAEMVAGVAAVAGVLNGGEHLETLREAAGIVDFVRISWHSGTLNMPDKVYRSVRKRRVVVSLMYPPWQARGSDTGRATWDWLGIFRA